MVRGVLFALGHTLVVSDEGIGDTKIGSTTYALLESLRRRELKLGIVSNGTADDVDRFGLRALVDTTVSASDTGVRKPDAQIFHHALSALGLEGYETLFVGDRLHEDVRGAEDVGMTTVQALWFRADEYVDGIEPDFMAFTQMDVLNIVERLNRE